jgi:hypothetical protein
MFEDTDMACISEFKQPTATNQFDVSGNHLLSKKRGRTCRRSPSPQQYDVTEIAAEPCGRWRCKCAAAAGGESGRADSASAGWVAFFKPDFSSSFEYFETDVAVSPPHQKCCTLWNVMKPKLPNISFKS